MFYTIVNGRFVLIFLFNIHYDLLYEDRWPLLLSQNKCEHSLTQPNLMWQRDSTLNPQSVVTGRVWTFSFPLQSAYFSALLLRRILSPWLMTMAQWRRSLDILPSSYTNLELLSQCVWHSALMQVESDYGYCERKKKLNKSKLLDCSSLQKQPRDRVCIYKGKTNTH